MWCRMVHLLLMLGEAASRGQDIMTSISFTMKPASAS